MQACTLTLLKVPLPLPPASLSRDESKVAAALRAAAAVLTVRHGAALRKAAVAQWELKLRVPDKSGAWRVVVFAPTGELPAAELLNKKTGLGSVWGPLTA